MFNLEDYLNIQEEEKKTLNKSETTINHNRVIFYLISQKNLSPDNNKSFFPKIRLLMYRDISPRC